MEDLEIHRKIDTDLAWQKVRQRLQDDGLLHEDDTRITGTRRISRWFSYAAAFLVIATVAGALYFLPDLRTNLLTVETGSGNTTHVMTLDDGTIIYLAGNSSLNYPEKFNKRQRKVSFSGEAFFDISNNEGQTFAVETDLAVVEVLGTAFNLRSVDGVFELIVEEGLVRVTPRQTSGKPEIVGQWEMVKGSGSGIRKSPVIDRSYVSWRMNRMQFRDEKLGNIASVISRNYNVNIEFENDELAERRLNVTFYDNDLHTIAEIIAFSFNLDYDIIPESGILFREKR